VVLEIRSPKILPTCVLVGLLSCGAAHAESVTIEYDVLALASPGNFEVRYTLTNVSLISPVSWFSIDFDPSLYVESSLLVTSTGLGNWSQTILGSIPILGIPAQYDAFKTVGAPLGIGTSEGGFSVQFTWLGTSAPAAQAFTVYDAGTLNVLYSGFTAPISEPSTTLLVLLGLSGVLVACRAAGVSLPKLRAS